MLETSFNIQWSELNTHDPQAAKSYFEKNFGWKFYKAPTETAPYLIAMQNNTPVAGIFTLSRSEADHICPHWRNYILAPDIEKETNEVLENGGKIVRDALNIPNIGRIVVLQKSNGEVIGMITPTVHH